MYGSSSQCVFLYHCFTDKLLLRTEWKGFLHTIIFLPIAVQLISVFLTATLEGVQEPWRAYEVALTAAGHCINSTCTPHNGGQRPHAPHPLKASPWGRSHRGGGRTRCQFVSDPILFHRLVGEVPGSWKKLIFCQYFEGKQDELGIYRAASLVLISGKNNRKAVTNAISKELRAGSITNGNQHSIMEKKSYHINLVSLQVCLAKLLGK